MSDKQWERLVMAIHDEESSEPSLEQIEWLLWGYDAETE